MSRGVMVALGSLEASDMVRPHARQLYEITYPIGWGKIPARKAG